MKTSSLHSIKYIVSLETVDGNLQIFKLDISLPAAISFKKSRLYDCYLVTEVLAISIPSRDGEFSSIFSHLQPYSITHSFIFINSVPHLVHCLSLPLCSPPSHSVSHAHTHRTRCIYAHYLFYSIFYKSLGHSSNRCLYKQVYTLDT